MVTPVSPANASAQNAHVVHPLGIESIDADQIAFRTREGAVQSAQTALQAAETDLAKTKAGARPQEIAQAEQAVKQATATRERSRASD